MRMASVSVTALVCLSAIGVAQRQTKASPANVLVVYAHDPLDQTMQLASSIKNGAESAGANVRLLAVEEANYKHDVSDWADAVIIGSGVYNGNAAPSILAFVDSFDFDEKHFSMVGGSFATGGGVVAGLEPVLEQISRGLRMFGLINIGGTSWKNAHGTGVLTNSNHSVLDDESVALAKDQGARAAQLATILKQASPSPSPSPGPTPSPIVDSPPPWGETWSALVSANLTQVGYDAGLVIVNFSGHCSDPSQQKMKTVYGDFDTVLTRCDMGREFIINPPSRGGGCTSRIIGKDTHARICEACSCPFCVRDTQGAFTHGEQYPSKTVWKSKEHTNIFGRDVVVWKGVAVSSEEEGQEYALSTSIAYSDDDSATPVFVNVTHPLWVQTEARIDNFSPHVDFHAFDIPDVCFNSMGQQHSIPERNPERSKNSRDPCVSKVPFLGPGHYSVSGPNRLTLRNQTKALPDVFLTANISASDQHGLLVNLRVSVDDGNAYNFVCTFTNDQAHVATCSLTFEEPARPEGPAWLQVTFSHFNFKAATGQCIAERVSSIGAFPYSHETDAAGVYAFDGFFRSEHDTTIMV